MTDRDDSVLERRLRDALRPRDPPDGFAERVAGAAERAAAAAEPARGADRAISRLGAVGLRVRLAGFERRAPSGRHAWLAAAATVTFAAALGAGATLWHQHTERRAARAARTQLLQALRISSETLDAALRITADPSRSG